MTGPALGTRWRMTPAWHVVAGRPVRSLVLGAPREGVPELVAVPGLGAPGYLLPGLRTCATWTRVHLLDVPGFGDRRTAGLPADLSTIAALVSGWLAQVPTGPVVLLGHSTGAQMALHAAADASAPPARVVAAGVTFPPEARRLLPLVGRLLRTLVHERPGELRAVLPAYLRGARRLPELLLSALADQPEAVVPRVPMPLLVLRGEHDRLCPQAWADRLARAAPDGHVVRLPGAHNVPWTHPEQFSAALAGWCR